MSVKRIPNPVGDPFAAALREAVGRIGEDGRLSGRDSRALWRALREHAADRSALLAEPEAVFGPFDSLAATAQQAVVETVASDGRWRMAAYNMGSWHALLTRRLWRAKRMLRYGRLASQMAAVLAASFEVGPGFGLHALYRRFLALRSSLVRRSRLGDVLSAAGLEVRDLAVRYARGVPQLSAYRGFWHDPSSHMTVGLIVGIDLIRNSEGYWFIESNMDCGLNAERTALCGEDPFVCNLLDFTTANGYRRLIVLSGSSSVEPGMARQYKQGAATRNLVVTLLEDAFRPVFGHERTVDVPGLEGDTILVRNRHYRTNIDYVVQNKRASSRALRIYKEESGDSSFQLPRTSDEPCVGPVDPADPFPNLVFKFPERDRGEGVFFLKVTSASHAREVLAETLRAAPSGDLRKRLYSRLDDQHGVYQPYVRTPMLPDRRLFKTRAHVLLTPVGAHFLSAHRMIGANPVPQDLPIGIVRDPQPYLVHFAPGYRYEVVPSEEEPEVRQAALGVARGLSRAISDGFETR